MFWSLWFASRHVSWANSNASHSVFLHALHLLFFRLQKCWWFSSVVSDFMSWNLDFVCVRAPVKYCSQDIQSDNQLFSFSSVYKMTFNFSLIVSDDHLDIMDKNKTLMHTWWIWLAINNAWLSLARESVSRDMADC